MAADEGLAERMCIVTREVRDESRLIRFVRSPEGEAVPDLARKLPGRGVWVSLSRATVEEAAKKRLFSRGFHAETRAADDLAQRTGRLLRQAALGYLALAKKAGEAVAGFTKVEGWLRQGKARVLIHAGEAADDGRRKLDRLVGDRLAGPDVAALNLFEAGELGLALGGAHVIHAAVAKGGLAEKLLAAARRIEAYEAGES